MSGALHKAAMRRLLAAYLCFKASEWGTWVAILIFAYGADGPAAVGVVATLQLVPAALVAPLAPRLTAGVGRRLHGSTPLAVAYACQAAAIAATALAIAFGPSPVVYGFAVIMTATMSFARPAHAAALVELAQTPAELSAANGLTGAIDGLGIVLGPALAGLLYVAIGPAAFLAAVAVLMFGSSVACRGLGARPLAGDSTESATDSPLAALRLLPGTPGAAVAALAVAATSIVAGIIDVLIVVAALGPLGAGEEAVGLLNAALGVGTMAAGAIAARYVLASRAPAVTVGLLVAALGLAAAGVVGAPLIVGLLLGVIGFGLGVGDIASRNVLLRLVPVGSTAQVFALVEAIYTGSLAVGSAIAPLLLAVLVVGQAFQATAVGLGVAAVLFVPPLLAAARLMRVPQATYELLHSLPIFRPLPVPAVELLARAADERQLPADARVIGEGERGDEFFAIASGTLTVTVGGRPVATLRPGDHFGEIALVRATVRTATVTTETPATLVALSRDDFLGAVLGHPLATRRVEDAVDARLEREPGLSGVDPTSR